MTLEERLVAALQQLGVDVKKLNSSVPIYGVYNSGSEPTGVPTGTVILVRP